MSQENVEIVRSIYEAVNRGDWDAAFRDQQPDVELTTPPGPNAGTYRGRAEIQSFWEEMQTPFEAWSVEPEEFFEHGDQIAVVVRARMRPKGSSAEIENRTGNLLDAPRGQGRVDANVPEAREGPRSRRTAGVGNHSPA
jgi:ketosteroid isomerase-like protein